MALDFNSREALSLLFPSPDAFDIKAHRRSIEEKLRPYVQKHGLTKVQVALENLASVVTANATARTRDKVITFTPKDLKLGEAITALVQTHPVYSLVFSVEANQIRYRPGADHGLVLEMEKSGGKVAVAAPVPVDPNDIPHERINDLCARGDRFAERDRFDKALACYQEASALIKVPREKWEATRWVMTAIGDAHFFLEEFDKALPAFKEALSAPGGVENPFLALRLGQCYYELKMTDDATRELTRAYKAAGRDVFESEEPKYIKFLTTKLAPQTGKRNL